MHLAIVEGDAEFAIGAGAIHGEGGRGPADRDAAIFIGAHGQGSKVSDAVLDGDDFDLVLGVRDDPKRADIIFNIQRHRIMPRGRVSR